MKTCSFCKTPAQKTSGEIPRALGEQDVQRLLTGADIFKKGSQWRPQIKFDIQSESWVTRPGASTIPRATAEPAWSTSAAGEHSPAWGSGQRYHLRGLNPSHTPSLAACACTEHCHPQPAAAALPGCWDRTRHGWTSRWVSWERGVCSCWYQYSFCLLSPIL